MESELVIGASRTSDFIYLFTLSAITLVMLLEAVQPRRQLQQNILWRWINNFSLASLTWYVSTIVSTAFIFYLVSLTQMWQFGLLPYFGAGSLLSFMALLTVSQLIGYVVHVAFHKIPWLWPIHAIHHTDVDVDVSTTYRHHPLEPLISLPLAAPAILLLGVPLEVAMIHKLFEIAISVFSHSNIRLPEVLDRHLRKLILTPDFHRLHHCSEQRFTDSNYGSVVPWFDYLYGTASTRPYEEQLTMELGLEYLREPRDGRLDRLIITPFRWRRCTAQTELKKSEPAGETHTPRT